MAIYQLIPEILREKMEQFERNKSLLCENGSFNTKNAWHDP